MRSCSGSGSTNPCAGSFALDEVGAHCRSNAGAPEDKGIRSDRDVIGLRAHPALLAGRHFSGTCMPWAVRSQAAW
ncbi:hypothetical protein GCM10010327_56300 [Streptomyces nitrosporeus]|nr:hypothetical protein GCM10010327_56300 [Streptomyces nitrosporeus]